MGGSVTKPNIPAKMEPQQGRVVSEEDLVKALMPIYYTKDPITPAEQEKVVKSWKLIASGQAAEFYRLKKADPDHVTSQTPMEFFGYSLVKRFIEVHPVVQHMFNKNTVKQGTLFFRMIAFTIAALDDESKFDSQFVQLARTHNRMGIRAVEYGIFGECLFWVLRLTLGTEIYDPFTHLGWVKIYSRILGIIIPVVIRYELDNRDVIQEKSIKRFQGMTAGSNRWSMDSSDCASVHSGITAPMSVCPHQAEANDVSISRMMAVQGTSSD